MGDPGAETDKYYTGVGDEDIFRRWLEAAGQAHRRFRFTRNQTINWHPLQRPLAESRVALVTTAGVHRKDQPAFDLHDHHGDLTYREIPSDLTPADLMITHSHYNHADADRDINCLLPIERIRELAASGVIGSVAPMHYGLMGFIPDGRPLIESVGPRLGGVLCAQGVDVVLLSPG
jgi:D-proline reductase (dithiol) PrdB